MDAERLIEVDALPFEVVGIEGEMPQVLVEAAVEACGSDYESHDLCGDCHQQHCLASRERNRLGAAYSHSWGAHVKPLKMPCIC